MNSYVQLIYGKGGKSLFNRRHWESEQLHAKESKMNYFLTPYTQLNSKWFKDLNVRSETIKLLEENICSIHLDIGLSNILLDLSPQARETKAKMNKWKFNKPKAFAQ